MSPVLSGSDSVALSVGVAVIGSSVESPGAGVH